MFATCVALAGWRSAKQHILWKEIPKMGQHGILNNTGPPTRHEPASVLRARASEYRRMGARASSTRDARALDDLAVRLFELAHEREFEERIATLEFDPLSGLPSHQALKIAADVARGNYVFPETLLHPV